MTREKRSFAKLLARGGGIVLQIGMDTSVCSRPLNCAQAWVASLVSRGDHVVDATAGNGHDTLFLSHLTGDTGTVDVFDIQQSALDSTAKRLAEAGCMHPGVKFHQMSHSRMAEVVSSGVRAVMFNLGYLPGGDKSVVTCKEDTMMALNSACDLLVPGGVLTVVCYPGHEGGDSEAACVSEWMKGLDAHQWRVASLCHWNAPGPAPFLLAAFRLR